MSKKMFMFWDRKINKMVTGDENNSLRLTVFGQPAPFSDIALPHLVNRYIPLRCAQHAPMLPDETGEARQLMEGDVISDGESPALIVFIEDALVWGVENSSPDDYWPLKELDATDSAILGNALANPKLVANWNILPDWDLLKERVEEWKAEQVKVDHTSEIQERVTDARNDIFNAESELRSARSYLDAAKRTLDGKGEQS